MRFKSLRPLALLILALSFTASAVAQSITAGDINGTLTDPTGAAIANAQVTIVNVATGDTRTAATTATGIFRFSLLSPGTYKVSATAPGFSTTTNTALVAAGSVATDNLKLSVGQGSTVVEVSTAPVLMNTENGDITTSFTSEQVQALPNPGNDLTFVAQTAPGSVMNTGGQSGTGYGNFSSFGISGLSNMFTLDGGYENDPFLNLNNTGASNLTLGNNEVDSVTVVAPAFSAQFGGLGGAQVSEITTAGANRVHGQLQYYWSGRAILANDWFNKQAGNPTNFVNANQWAASIGGPVIHDKLFWYVNTEGMRVTTPTSGQVYAPSSAFENCSLYGIGCAALNAAALVNCEGPTGPYPVPPAAVSPTSTCVGDPNYSYAAFAQATASQIPLLTRIFNTYDHSPYRTATVSADPNDVSAVSYYTKASTFLSEWLLMGRVDYKISDKDNVYIHYKQDHGVQPTYTDLIDPSFTTQSPQPSWEGQINETHTFTPNLTNQLVIAGNYYSAPFQNTHTDYVSKAPFTFIFINGDLGAGADYYGGIDYAFPQGRRVSGYQIIDDVTYNKGRSTLRFGYNFRRDNVTDLDQNRSIVGVAEGSVEEFGAGKEGYEQSQYFPLRSEQPVAVYNEGVYVQDEFKLRPNFTVTAGLRLERNSNPTCLTHCLQTLAYPVASLPTGTASTTTPYQHSAAYPTGFINSGRLRAFTGYQKFAILPRLAFNFQPFGNGKTVVRGGFGMFSDTFPGLIADTLMGNVPDNFHALAYGPDAGPYASQLLDPSTPGSGGAYATASAHAFESSYATGGTYASTSAAVTGVGGVYSAPAFSTTDAHMKYPTYEEFSLAVEQKIDSKTTVSATYVGNHGYHEPVGNGGSNLASTGSTSAHFNNPNFFPTVPTARPVTAFGTITNYYSGASSNFNGVVLGATRRSKQLSLQFNYEFSKALDEMSNGGLEPFGGSNGDAETVANPNNLHAQYGPSDYNVTHNLTGSFVWTVPGYGHNYLVKEVLGGLEFSGSVFHQSGLPYSVLQSTTNIGDALGSGKTSSFSAGTVNLFARQLSNNFDHHCGGGNHALHADGTNPNPCNFTSAFGAPTNFTQQGRNSLRGPSYTNVDFGAFKVFAVPYISGMKLKAGAQFFNLFNHPNFNAPDHTLSGTGVSSYGALTGTVSSPTSIFGSVGASASPRIVQLKATLQF